MGYGRLFPGNSEEPGYMNDRVNEPMDQPRIDQRANLLYFLQRLSRVAEPGDHDSGRPSEVSNEPHAEYKRTMVSFS